MRLTKKNIENTISELIKDWESWEKSIAANKDDRDGWYSGYRHARAYSSETLAKSLYKEYISEDDADFSAFRKAVLAKKTTKKEEPKTIKSTAPIRSMEEPKKAVETAKKTETAPKTTIKKTTKRTKKTAEIIPINAANGTPFTGRNKETALAFLEKINSTDGRFYTWNGKKDAGYRVKAGESGLKMAYFGKDSRGTYPVWHISQLVKTVDANAAEKVKETIKREITLDDNDGGNGKKKVFKVTIRK